MYLLDTNIILELLLDREGADDVERLLRNTSPETLHLSEFSLYSLGVVLMRRKLHDLFVRAVDDLLVRGGVRLVRLGVKDMLDIANASERFNLDFDDAYQHTIAEKYNLTLVSFDADFDRTPRVRKTPAELLS